MRGRVDRGEVILSTARESYDVCRQIKHGGEAVPWAAVRVLQLVGERALIVARTGCTMRSSASWRAVASASLCRRVRLAAL